MQQWMSHERLTFKGLQFYARLYPYSHERNTRMSKQEDANERAANLAGLGAGILTGAQIGTRLAPGVGTFAGALVGGVLGSQVGRTVGATALNMLGLGSPNKKQPASSAEMMMQLERLSQMRAQGILSEDEFAAAKSQLLGL
jgi:hypothetical protein